MKNTVLLFLLFTSSFLFSQSFTLLESDSGGDVTINGVVDLRSIWYAMDELNDSLWFKLDLHTALPGDLGIVFGIDTDLIPGNGLNWDSSNNTDLFPEVVFTINRNFIDPSFLYGFSSNNLNQVSRFGDNDSTIIVNMKLSTLDDDGRFNFIVGASTFDCDVNNRSIFDDLPDNGFLTIDMTSAISAEFTSQNLKIYPNPVKDYLYLQHRDLNVVKSISVINSQGQLILDNLSLGDNGLDLSGLINGVYFLTFQYENTIFSKKFVKL